MPHLFPISLRASAMAAAALGFAAVALPGLAQETPAASGARIASITLYPGVASVQRVLRLAPGARHAVFACLPATLDAASLQASGSADVRIGELTLRQQPRELLGATCASALDERIRALEDELATLQAQVGGIDFATGYFKGFGADGSTRATPPAQIAATAQALRQGGQEALQRRHRLAREQERLEQVLKPLLAERDRAGRKDALVSTVQVTLAAPQGGELRLSYQVRGPGWQPGYRAALDSASGRLRLERLAQVAQNTGEDWDDVPITLSTGQPGAATEGPLPRPWRVGIQPPVAEAPIAVMAAPAPAPRARLVESAKAGADEPGFDVSVFQGSYATEFRVSQRVRVPSGGERVTLALGEQLLDARLLTRTTPALDAHAYLVAEFAVPPGVWPAGPISLIRDGAYVGSARFDAAQAGRDGLAFGRDELVNVRAERPEQQEGTGGFIGSRNQRVDSRRYLVENRHAGAITLQVLDAAPVPEHEDVRVESRYEPAPQTETWNGQQGNVAWEQSLAAGATQAFSAVHAISWPKDARLRER
ncbi:MAG TPA: DUF4139 domain-containing protein [Ottowia sp.]|uniref:DUF4139 domain-containing protein n=1 Tax=Ottowia sp. TaxID=1898956 RepID=UPI002D1182B3|nr:DUF4139 domain-containing protein [Ottowia sp.]HMN21989.1 DUF4139 domain-containing protein [Ottowia sp.]